MMQAHFSKGPVLPRSTPDLFVLAVAIVTTAVGAAVVLSSESGAAQPPSGVVSVDDNAVAPPGSGVLYVDDDAPPGGHGHNWRHAIRYLQDALDKAERSRGAVREIRVAQGVYKPDQGLWVEPLDQHATFFLVDGLALRGGYRGRYAGPGNPHERNIELFRTYLSGDLLGDGFDYDDNSFHILTAMYVGEGTELDGFEIREATDDPDALPPEPTSGALLVFGGEPLIQRCTFADNRGHNDSGSLVLNDSNAVVRRCLFWFNLSNGNAAAMAARFGNPIIEDCRFQDNVAFYETGGAISVAQSAATIRRCMFTNNSAGNEGGAMIMINCPLAEVEDCDFIDNVAGWGGGAVRFGGLFRRCTFIGNYASTWGGAIDGGGTLIDCLFANNETSSQGGGAIYGGADFVNCIFRGNVAGASSEGGGGALWLWWPTTLTNCLLAGNYSGGAGGAILLEGNPSVAICNATIVGNSGIGPFGQAVVGTVALENSIVWANAGGALGSGVTASFSCIEGGAVGVGNISAPPKFVNMLGADGRAGTLDDDLRLRFGSPCIDAGDNALLPADVFDLDGDNNVTEPLPFDLAGHARVVPGYNVLSPIVDMGTFEFARSFSSTSLRPVNLTP